MMTNNNPKMYEEIWGIAVLLIIILALIRIVLLSGYVNQFTNARKTKEVSKLPISQTQLC